MKSQIENESKLKGASHDASRRSFMTKVVTSGAAVAVASHANSELAAANTTGSSTVESDRTRPSVLFLDVNETLLDLSPLKETVGGALGGRADLLPLWFKAMLQYSLVSTVADRYEDFTVIGGAVLQMVARNNGIELSPTQANKAIEPIRSLQPHPDVEPALQKLTDAGFKLCTLTNSSTKGVEQQMLNSGLQKYLDARLSIEEIGLYKPHAHVYRWAARKMKAEVGDCMLLAAHGWDVAGAMWAGMRAGFISRPGAQLYSLGPKPEINEPTLELAADNLIEMRV